MSLYKSTLVGVSQFKREVGGVEKSFAQRVMSCEEFINLAIRVKAGFPTRKYARHIITAQLLPLPLTNCISNMHLYKIPEYT